MARHPPIERRGTAKPPSNHPHAAHKPPTSHRQASVVSLPQPGAAAGHRLASSWPRAVPSPRNVVGGTPPEVTAKCELIAIGGDGIAIPLHECRFALGSGAK